MKVGYIIIIELKENEIKVIWSDQLSIFEEIKEIEFYSFSLPDLETGKKIVRNELCKIIPEEKIKFERIPMSSSEFIRIITKLFDVDWISNRLDFKY